MAAFETLFHRLRNRVLFRYRRAQLDRELAEELEFHRQQMAPGRHMGNMTLAKEECREAWSFMAWENLIHDLRHAFRMFRRTPVFTGIAVLSLGLGIGSNAGMFSLVNTLLIQPLPYQQPERLVRITGIYPRAAIPFFSQQSRTLEVASASTGSDVNLTGHGMARRVHASKVSPNFLSVLGVGVSRGRAFHAGEDTPGADGVTLIGERLWKEQFGADSSAVGRVITVDGVSRQIVGILPAGFGYPSADVELWTPMRLDPSNFLEYWGTEFMPLLGRLRPGASLAAAQADVHRLTDHFRKTFPYPMARNWNTDSTAIPLQRDIVGDVRGKLIILLVSVGMVLLIACTNVASLLLSRATTRQKEMALRAALGAGRLRIIRQLLTESVGLALMGAALGLGVGKTVLSIFKSILPAATPGLAHASIDWSVVLVVIALAVLSGLSFGLAPALSASQVNLTSTMKTGSQRSTSTFWSRFRGGIIGIEVALTLILVIGAGLLLRSLQKLSNTDPGFQSSDIVTVRLSPNQLACAQRSSCVAFYDRLLERARRLESAQTAAIANSVPLDGELPTIPVEVQDHPNTPDHPAPMLWLGAVTPDYFSLLHIPLLAGRYLTASDGAETAPVVLISAATARHFWPHENAIGRHIRTADGRQWRSIVGIVGDVHQDTLSRALPAWVEGAVYMPYAQSATEGGQLPAMMTLLVKTAQDGGEFRSRLQQLAQHQDPNVPVGHVRSLDEIMSGSITNFRSLMQVFVSFACTAMLLAGIGIYGLMSYWVSQRAYEIGLRLAIGATRPQIVSLIVAQGLKISLWGIVAGLAGALLLTRMLNGFLYGIVATDLTTFSGVTVLVLLIAVLATAFPALRAMRVDPVRSLRAE